jgi:hypothetical protein
MLHFVKWSALKPKYGVYSASFSRIEKFLILVVIQLSDIKEGLGWREIHEKSIN